MKSAIIVAVEPEGYPVGLVGDFEKNCRFLSGLGFDGGTGSNECKPGR